MKEQFFINSKPLYMNMSGIYDGKENVIDCTDIGGTNGYCDENAAKEIKRRITAYDFCGVHFLDSGNYHYLSYFWLEKIRQDFSLVMIDHHPDLLRPAFGDILSCGGWVGYALERLSHLKRVYLVDVDEKLLEEIDPLPEQVIALSKKEILTFDLHNLPVYLSIDKDVLSGDVVRTDWDQGNMREQELSDILDVVADTELLGIDICGEIRENRTMSDKVCHEAINTLILQKFSGKHTGGITA